MIPTTRYIQPFATALAFCSLVACSQSDATPAPDVQKTAPDEQHPVSSAGEEQTGEYWRLSPQFDIAKVLLSRDSRRVVLVGENGEVQIADLPSRESVQVSSGVSDPVFADFAPDHSELWIIGRNQALGRLDPVTGSPRKSVGVSGNATVWETVDEGMGLRIESPAFGAYDVYGESESRPVVSLQGKLIASAEGRLFHNGRIIVSANTADSLSVWDAATRQGSDAQRKGIPPAASALACGGYCLLTAQSADDDMAYFWSDFQDSLESERIAGRLFLDSDKLGQPRLAGDASGSMIVAQIGGELAIMQLQRGATPSFKHKIDMVVASARMSPDGQYVIATDSDGAVSILRSASLTAVPLSPDIDAVQTHAVVGPKAMRLILQKIDGTSALLVLPDTTPRPLPLDTADALPYFSSTGRWLALLSPTGTLQILDTDQISRSVYDLGEGVEHVLFTPDDGFAVIQLQGGGVSIWQLHPTS